MEKKITIDDCEAAQTAMIHLLQTSPYRDGLQAEIAEYDTNTREFLTEIKERQMRAKLNRASVEEHNLHDNLLDSFEGMLRETSGLIIALATPPTAEFTEKYGEPKVDNTTIVKNRLDLDLYTLGVYFDTLTAHDLLKGRMPPTPRTLH